MYSNPRVCFDKMFDYSNGREHDIWHQISNEFHWKISMLRFQRNDDAFVIRVGFAMVMLLTLIFCKQRSSKRQYKFIQIIQDKVIRHPLGTIN